ncbi:MAG: rod-binding protein [Bacillota bacterium]
MEINNNYMQQQLQLSRSQEQESADKIEENAGRDKEKLEKAVSEFTSIFMKQMFKAMRSSLPEEKLIDGGFAEDVFTDMMDEEISKLGANQQGLDSLNQQLYDQLTGKM